jgi:hypothetical protein
MSQYYDEYANDMYNSVKQVTKLEQKEEIDWFQHHELLPKEVQKVLLEHCTGENSYEACQRLIQELEPLGWTCEYGLDAEPYNLRKIK